MSVGLRPEYAPYRRGPKITGVQTGGYMSDGQRRQGMSRTHSGLEGSNLADVHGQSEIGVAPVNEDGGERGYRDLGKPVSLHFRMMTRN